MTSKCRASGVKHVISEHVICSVRHVVSEHVICGVRHVITEHVICGVKHVISDDTHPDARCTANIATFVSAVIEIAVTDWCNIELGRHRDSCNGLVTDW